jgi:hypothetical protein
MVDALHAMWASHSTAPCQKHEAIHKNSRSRQGGLPRLFVALQQQKGIDPLDIMWRRRA